MTDTFDYSLASQNLRNREIEKTNARRQLHEKASGDAERIITTIREQFNPAIIYQWGSLLTPDQFDENSDIDIAVEGLSGPDQFFALRNAAVTLTELSLDIVEFESIDDLARDSIITHGKVVYERK